MLVALRIKNLALVSDLTLELQPGCNVITGETGAGKSIIIGALNLVLGERADRTLIRSGSDSCSVEAVFDVSRLKAPLPRFLEENGLEPCEGGQLVLKRTFNASGANRQFVNGSPATLSVLAAIGEWLVDMHGPHDHQSLLHPSKQLAILDAFAGLEEERERFCELLRCRGGLEEQKAALIVDERTYAQQLELLRFKTNEIRMARVQPDEEEQVAEEYRRAGNAAKLLQLCQSALEVIGENENAILTQAGAVGRILNELQRLDSAAGELTSQHEQIASAIRELQDGLSRYADKIEVDPQRLNELEERLDLLQSLKRKYGPTLADVVAHGEDAAQRLQTLEQREEELARLNSDIAQLDAALLKAGKALTLKRKKAIPELSRSVAKHLADLGFKQSTFEVTQDTLEKPDFAQWRGATGLDRVEFQFAPNPGEPAKPLRAIASSGELARVMLALKTALAAQDQIPVLVFDEVDANVGGETAHVVGEKMRQISRNRQVLCITHLPQVAATAAAHYVVTKQVKNGRTVSEISLLDRKQRVTEMSRMLGGQTDAARKHAEALLK